MAGGKGLLVKFAAHPVVQGTAVAVVIGLAGAVFLSLIFYATPLSEAYLQPAGNILYLTGAFFGGFFGAKKAGRKGVLFGVATGLCYFLVFSILILIIDPAALNRPAFVLKGLYSLTIAAVGGVFGIALGE